VAVVYLGFGSNMGNREKNIQDALKLLEENYVHVEKRSQLIETNPVGGPPQGLFLNAAAKVHADLSPLELLKLLKRIEKQLGRVKTVINAPRTIDIDILLYDNQNISTPELTIPHPRMKERDFVLKPLKEIYPDFVKDFFHANHSPH